MSRKHHFPRYSAALDMYDYEAENEERDSWTEDHPADPSEPIEDHDCPANDLPEGPASQTVSFGAC